MAEEALEKLKAELKEIAKKVKKKNKGKKVPEIKTSEDKDAKKTVAETSEGKNSEIVLDKDYYKKILGYYFPGTSLEHKW